MLSVLFRARSTRRLGPAVTVLASLLLLAAPGSALGFGGPDAGFSGGIVQLSTPDTQFRAVAPGPHGTVIAVGTRGLSAAPKAAKLIVARFLAGGTLDPSFGSGGLATGPDPGTGGSVGRAVAVLANGQIIVAGTASDATGTARNGMLLERFNPNGILDSTFGSGGKALALGSSAGEGLGLAVQSNGALIVSGAAEAGAQKYDFVALARFKPTGTPDASFGGSSPAGVGTVVSQSLGNYSYAYAVIVDPSGRIVVVGSQRPQLQTLNGIIARFTSSGALDSSFNNSGARPVFPTGGSASLEFQSVVLQGSNLVAVGAMPVGLVTDAVVVRLTGSGSLDGGFGSGGSVQLPAIASPQGAAPLTPYPGAYGVTVSKSDIVVAGFAVDNQQVQDPTLWALTGNGTLDSGFGSGGIAQRRVPPTTRVPSFGQLYGISLACDGSLLVAGSTLADAAAGPSGLAARYAGNGATSTAAVCNSAPGGKVTPTNLSLALKRHHHRTDTSFAFDGRLSLPGAATGGLCTGSVSVQIMFGTHKVGKGKQRHSVPTVIGSKTVSLGRGCAYSGSVTIKNSVLTGKHATTATASFSGNRSVNGKQSSTVTVH